MANERRLSRGAQQDQGADPLARRRGRDERPAVRQNVREGEAFVIVLLARPLLE